MVLEHYFVYLRVGYNGSTQSRKYYRCKVKTQDLQAVIPVLVDRLGDIIYRFDFKYTCFSSVDGLWITCSVLSSNIALLLVYAFQSRLFNLMIIVSTIFIILFYLFICLFIYLFIYLFVYLFIYLFIYFYLFIYLCIYLFIYLFIFLSFFFVKDELDEYKSMKSPFLLRYRVLTILIVD